jgi:hypothetical protein
MAYNTLGLYNLGTDEAKQINKAVEDLIRAAHAMGLQQAYAEIYPTDLQQSRYEELKDICLEKHMALNRIVGAAIEKGY